MSEHMSADFRKTLLRASQVLGAVLGYGCLAAFLLLVGMQSYRWLRDGEWTHVGVSEGMRAALVRCCVHEGGTGRLAGLVHWIDTPTDWLGLHTVLDVMPASLALFLLSMFGNSVFIYCRDRMSEGAPSAGGVPPSHK